MDADVVVPVGVCVEQLSGFTRVVDEIDESLSVGNTPGPTPGDDEETGSWPAVAFDLHVPLLQVAVPDRQRRLLIAHMVVATIDAGVHDVIIRQPRGVGRRSAVELTISTALSIIENETARQLRTT